PLPSYEKTVEIREGLSRDRPDDLDGQKELAVAYFRLGIAQASAGRDAMDAMSRSVDIRQALILKLPDDPTLHYAVGQSLVRFADYLPYWGHFDDALVLLLRAQEYYRFAYGKLPNNVHYGLDLSISFLLTAKAYWNVGRPEEAVGEARKAVEHLRRMARDNPS